VKRAFTLIELLIVVAIIAILAAIAVPNFLEAQTRSKIARVQSDLRTIATAIEAYRVDNRHSPIGHWESVKWQPSYFGLNETGAIRRIWAAMTTPVAYITSPPSDPFATSGKSPVTGNPISDDYVSRLYAYNSIRVNSLQGVYLADVYEVAAGRGATWVTWSLGPTFGYSPDNRGKQIVRVPGRQPSTGSYMGYPDLIYDATNGTISFGYVIRTSLGDP